MAAKLHGDTLHVTAGQRRELLADRRRAGERDLFNHRMRDQIGRHLRRHAEHQIDHARRHPGVGISLHQSGATRRGFLRPLQDHGAAGRQRRRHLAHRLIDREIPRRESRDRPDRLLEHKLRDVRRARRHDPSVGAARFLREPFNGVGAAQRLDPRLGKHLALLHRHRGGDGVGAFADQRSGAPHDLRALHRARPLPFVEGAVGRGQRIVEILAAGMRQRANGLASRRIEHRNPRLAAVAPLPVNIELRVGVFRHSRRLPG